MAAGNPRRSRKRGQRARTRPAPQAQGQGQEPAARVETQAPAEPAPPPDSEQTFAEVARSRSEERNAAIRATLTPLGPDERPWPIVVGAALALVIAISNVVQVIIGGKVEFDKQHVTPVGPLIFAVIMVACAVGMWRKRYWAVLGFQALLALVVLFFALLLIRAENVLAVVIGVAVVGGGGFLFFKLVRVLSRLQLPQTPRPRSRT